MTKAQQTKDCTNIVGSLSAPSKMPCSSYSIPAIHCKIGSKLMHVENSTCFYCYAKKGMYTFPGTKSAMEKRFKSITSPLWVETMIKLITLGSKGDKAYFRWHDSGDIQDVDHLDKICQIAEALPEKTFWLPTREYGIVNSYTGTIPSNLTIRYSEHMNDRVTKNVTTKQYGSIVVSSTDKVTELQKTTDKPIQVCPSSKQGNKCLDCRACWHFDGIIAYLKH